MDRALSS